jgi:hypothetical protein
LFFVVAGLFRDAAVRIVHAMDPLKTGELGDRSQMSQLGFSVLVDGGKDRVDRRGVRRDRGGDCSGNGTAGSDGE